MVRQTVDHGQRDVWPWQASGGHIAVILTSIAHNRVSAVLPRESKTYLNGRNRIKRTLPHKTNATGTEIDIREQKNYFFCTRSGVDEFEKKVV